MSDVRDWQPKAQLNTAAPPDGAPEGEGFRMRDINNTIREMMASVRRHRDRQMMRQQFNAGAGAIDANHNSNAKHNVFWTGSRWLVGGINGKIFISGGAQPDLFYLAPSITWGGYGGAENVVAFARLGDRLFAFSDGSTNEGGHAVKSDDGGETWVPEFSLLADLDHPRAAAVNGDGTLMAAVGDGNQIVTSDGEGGWTARTSAFTGGDLKWVVYGNGLFVAGGTGIHEDNEAEQIMTSEDGETWTARATPGSDGDTALYDCAFNGSAFVAAGDGSVYRSEDGETWDLVEPPGPVELVRTVAAIGVTFALFPYVASPATGQQTLLSFDGGETWERLLSSPSTVYRHRGWAWNGEYLVTSVGDFGAGSAVVTFAGG